MTNAGKIRITLFIVILLMICYFSVGYTYEIFNTNLESTFIDTARTDSVIIDGTDFTPMFRLFGNGLNSFFEFVTYVIYAVILLLISLFFLLPLRLIGIKKNTRITNQEKKITCSVFAGFLLLSVITGLILTKGTVILPLLTYTLIWATVTFCTYVLTVLKRACKTVSTLGTVFR